MKRQYKRKLTLWFTGHQKPVHVGPYQASSLAKYRRGSPIFWAYWDGFQWSILCRTMEDAINNKRSIAAKMHQTHAWRGRTEP